MSHRNMDVARRYLSGPQIARLLLRERTWAWRRLTAGDFGPTVRVGRHRDLYAAREGVERFAGMSFTAEQLAAAVDGKPCRILTQIED